MNQFMGLRGPQPTVTAFDPTSERTSSPRKPPSTLHERGARLWREMIREHDIDGTAELAILRQICEMVDRAESLRARVAADGEMLTAADGTLRDHPALRHEQNARAFVVRGLSKLTGGR
jgi:hypothetical protein